MAIGDPYYAATLLKASLGIAEDDTSEDDELELACAAATAAINDRIPGGTFWKTATPEARQIDATGRVLMRSGLYPYTKLLLPVPVASATGLIVGSYASTQIKLDPSDAIARGKPATALKLPYGATFGTYGEVSITATWGWPAVPDNVTWAAKMQAHRYYKRKGSPEGIAGSAEWGLASIPRLDPDVRAIIETLTAGMGIA
jgi:hypothetical protein